MNNTVFSTRSNGMNIFTGEDKINQKATIYSTKTVHTSYIEGFVKVCMVNILYQPWGRQCQTVRKIPSNKQAKIYARHENDQSN